MTSCRREIALLPIWCQCYFTGSASQYCTFIRLEGLEWRAEIVWNLHHIESRIDNGSSGCSVYYKLGVNREYYYLMLIHSDTSTKRQRREHGDYLLTHLRDHFGYTILPPAYVLFDERTRYRE